MTTVLDRPVAPPDAAAADRLRRSMAAARLSVRWWGVRKSLTRDQKAEAAEPFGAEADFLSAGKKIVDTSHPAFKAVTTIRNKAVQFWKSVSLPFTSPSHGHRTSSRTRTAGGPLICRLSALSWGRLIVVARRSLPKRPGWLRIGSANRLAVH